MFSSGLSPASVCSVSRYFDELRPIKFRDTCFDWPSSVTHDTPVGALAVEGVVGDGRLLVGIVEAGLADELPGTRLLCD